MRSKIASALPQSTSEVSKVNDKPIKITKYSQVAGEEIETVERNVEEVEGEEDGEPHHTLTSTTWLDNANQKVEMSTMKAKHTAYFMSNFNTPNMSKNASTNNMTPPRGLKVNKCNPVPTSKTKIISQPTCNTAGKQTPTIGNDKLGKMYNLGHKPKELLKNPPIKKTIMKDPTIKNTTIKDTDIEDTSTKANTLKDAIKTSNENKKEPKGNDTKSKDNERELTKIELKNLLEVQKIDRNIKSPEFIYGINTRKKSINELLQRAIYNAARHGLSLKPGTINNADGECLWESLMYNITQRQRIKHYTKETPRQLKQRSINNAQKHTELKKLPFIPENTTEEEWNHISI